MLNAGDHGCGQDRGRRTGGRGRPGGTSVRPISVRRPDQVAFLLLQQTRLLGLIVHHKMSCAIFLVWPARKNCEM
jgi:hypothetical protein